PQALMNTQESITDWSDYKRTKHCLIALLIFWIPFGALTGVLLPAILHTFIVTYILALVYVLFTGYAWLQYAFFPCPNCDIPYRGRQLWRRTCPKCGVEINT
ncbi:MAG: hypothetical protein WBF45_15590, partial [Acidobacteriaceae bacterium]